MFVYFSFCRQSHIAQDSLELKMPWPSFLGTGIIGVHHRFWHMMTNGLVCLRAVLREGNMQGLEAVP